MNAGQLALGRDGTTISRSKGSACSNQRPERPQSSSSKANPQEPQRSIQRSRRSCGRGWRSASVLVLVIFSPARLAARAQCRARALRARIRDGRSRGCAQARPARARLRCYSDRDQHEDKRVQQQGGYASATVRARRHQAGTSATRNRARCAKAARVTRTTPSCSSTFYLGSRPFSLVGAQGITRGLWDDSLSWIKPRKHGRYPERRSGVIQSVRNAIIEC